MSDNSYNLNFTIETSTKEFQAGVRAFCRTAGEFTKEKFNLKPIIR